MQIIHKYVFYITSDSQRVLCEQNIWLLCNIFFENIRMYDYNNVAFLISVFVLFYCVVVFKVSFCFALYTTSGISICL